MEHFFMNYWWIFVVALCLVLYKFILRFLFGMVIVPEDKIGLVTKKFVLLAITKSCQTVESSPHWVRQVFKPKH